MKFFKRFRKIILISSMIYFIKLIPQIYSLNIGKFNYSEKFIHVPIDHFNFINSNIFPLRYLKNSLYVKNNEIAPIFFYCGHEDDIEKFAEITGFLWETAEKFEAEIIFAEHRYYGKSLPFGNNSFVDNEHIGYLTIEQALADFAYLLDNLLNKNYNRRAVIAFGGSYGGILAAWLRIKYPHIITGALASSAHILSFGNLIPCHLYHDNIAAVFDNAYTKSCTSNIKRFYKLLSSPYIDTAFFIKKFNICNINTNNVTLKDILYLLKTVYWNLAFANYPYEFNLLEALPAYPVKNFCKKLHKDYYNNDLIKAMYKAINIYKNYTGDKKCLDLSFHEENHNRKAWYFQRCTQLRIPMCISKNNKMFLEEEFDYDKFVRFFPLITKVKSRDRDLVIRYGGNNFDFASNIIFSNGMLDPLFSAGILTSPNEKISIIIIPDGAHHFDLRSTHAKDPLSVREARRQEIAIFSQWIQIYYANHSAEYYDTYY